MCITIIIKEKGHIFVGERNRRGCREDRVEENGVNTIYMHIYMNLKVKLNTRLKYTDLISNYVYVCGIHITLLVAV